jgi:mono/diheme cytochrome c family protein
MQPRTVRLVVVPALLLLSVSGLTFGLAQLHPAKADQPSRSVTIHVSADNDRVRGERLFAENCATCHGEGGSGGGVGPRLAGNDVSIGETRSTIENGSGVMPADLVEGQDLEDVLAYLETILAGAR